LTGFTNFMLVRLVGGRSPARRLGSPQDVAGPVVFLCSDRANYITGIELPVNGGQLFYP